MTRALMERPIPQDPRAKSVGLLVGPEKRHGRSKFASKIASGDCLRVPSIDDISAPKNRLPPLLTLQARAIHGHRYLSEMTLKPTLCLG
jgi:hypothetical protein